MKTLVMAVLVTVAMAVGCAGTEWEPSIDLIGVEDTGFEEDTESTDVLEGDEGSDVGTDTVESDEGSDVVGTDTTGTDTVVVCDDGYEINEEGTCELIVCLTYETPRPGCGDHPGDIDYNYYWDSRGFTCSFYNVENPCTPLYRITNEETCMTNGQVCANLIEIKMVWDDILIVAVNEDESIGQTWIWNSSKRTPYTVMVSEETGNAIPCDGECSGMYQIQEESVDSLLMVITEETPPFCNYITVGIPD